MSRTAHELDGVRRRGVTARRTHSRSDAAGRDTVEGGRCQSAVKRKVEDARGSVDPDPPYPARGNEQADLRPWERGEGKRVLPNG